MFKMTLSPRAAFYLFLTITIVLLAQAVWWIAFMAHLVNEKVEMAAELGATKEYVAEVHRQEISRQIMLGSEGVFFLVLVGVGALLIYRTLVKTEQLKFHQQNFLMAVTHELKTPLASMKIYIDTLQSTKIPEEKKIAILPRLKEDANRLERLVENVLEAGRFERSGYQLNRESFDFSRLVDRLLTKLQAYPSKTPIEIKRRRFESDLQIFGDEAALGRALEAILENSVKYNDKDRIMIGIELFRTGKRIYLNIADNGIGLGREDTTLIFNRFYRVGQELNRSKPGTGLGLYLCREIIKAHGGNISARSEGAGRGVTFNITLEANADNENDTAG